MDDNTTQTPTEPTAQIQQPIKPPRKKRTIILLLSLVLLTVLSVAAYFVFLKKDQEGNTSTTTQQKTEPSVTLYYRDGTTILAEDILKNDPTKTQYRNLIAAVVDDLKEKYGEDYSSQGAWKVVTTLDKSVQSTSEQAVKDSEGQFSKQGVDRGGMLTQDVTNGQILSWVDSLYSVPEEDFLSSPVMIGGLIKPFVYASAINRSNSLGAGSKVSDTQRPLDGYPCTDTTLRTGNCLYNYDFRYSGEIPLRYSLAGMRNVPAADLASQIGIANVLKDFAGMSGREEPSCYADFALSEKTQCYLAASLGDGLYASPRETITAYSTLANNGKQQAQTIILKTILNGAEKDSWDQGASTQPIKDETAYIINDILADPRASYYTDKTIFTLGNSPVSYVHGITNDAMTAHVMTYTSRYVVGFWTSQKESGSTGIGETFTIPVALTTLDALEKLNPSPQRTKPSSLQSLPAHVATNHVGIGSIEPSPSTDLFPSWYKAQ